MYTGGSWVGALYAAWSESVATYADSDLAYNIITDLYVTCYNSRGQLYSSDGAFHLTLPSDPHWPDHIQTGYGGYGFSYGYGYGSGPGSDYNQKNGYTNISLTYDHALTH